MKGRNVQATIDSQLSSLHSPFPLCFIRYIQLQNLILSLFENRIGHFTSLSFGNVAKHKYLCFSTPTQPQPQYEKLASWMAR